jgi:hypothetical protein
MAVALLITRQGPFFFVPRGAGFHWEKVSTYLVSSCQESGPQPACVTDTVSQVGLHNSCKVLILIYCKLPLLFLGLQQQTNGPHSKNCRGFARPTFCPQDSKAIRQADSTAGILDCLEIILWFEEVTLCELLLPSAR